MKIFVREIRWWVNSIKVENIILISLIFFTEFNLGPLHCLETLTNKLVKVRTENNKGFLLKRKSDGTPATRFSRLKGGIDSSSSATTYRNGEMKKAHLLLELWTEQKKSKKEED